MVLKFQPMQETEFGRDFWRMFWVSLTLHLALLALVNYSRKMWTPPVFYAPPSYTVDLVSVERPKPQRKARPQPKAPPKPASVAKPEPKPESAKPVPAKVEPEKKIAIPDAVPKKPAPVPKKPAAKVDKPAEKPAEKKPVEKKPVEKKPPEEAYNEKQISSALADLKKRVSRQRAAEEKAQAARGKITSRVMEIKNKAYQNAIYSIIDGHYQLPKGIHAEPDLEVIVGGIITKVGRIQDLEFVKRSANEAFNQAVIRSLERSSPLPPPPGQEDTAFEMRFSPSGVQE